MIFIEFGGSGKLNYSHRTFYAEEKRKGCRGSLGDSSLGEKILKKPKYKDLNHVCTVKGGRSEGHRQFNQESNVKPLASKMRMHISFWK